MPELNDLIDDGEVLGRSGSTPVGVPVSDFATATQGGKADNAVQPGDLAPVATSGDYGDLSNRPDLGAYLPLAGGTLTGPLTLDGDATAALHPVTKRQLDNATSASVNFLAAGAVHAQTNFSSFTQSSTFSLGSRRTSSGALNASVTFAVPGTLEAGAWDFTLLHDTAANRGIYTIETSPNGTDWTAADSSIDGYSDPSVNMARGVATGVAIPAGTRFLRLRAMTKNASSSSYFLSFSHFSGQRTGN